MWYFNAAIYEILYAICYMLNIIIEIIIQRIRSEQDIFAYKSGM